MQRSCTARRHVVPAKDSALASVGLKLPRVFSHSLRRTLPSSCPHVQLQCRVRTIVIVIMDAALTQQQRRLVARLTTADLKQLGANKHGKYWRSALQAFEDLDVDGELLSDHLHTANALHLFLKHDVGLDALPRAFAKNLRKKVLRLAAKPSPTALRTVAVVGEGAGHHSSSDETGGQPAATTRRGERKRGEGGGGHGGGEVMRPFVEQPPAAVGKLAVGTSQRPSGACTAESIVTVWLWM